LESQPQQAFLPLEQLGAEQQRLPVARPGLQALLQQQVALAEQRVAVAVLVHAAATASLHRQAWKSWRSQSSA
jgi:hypothetical protein